MNNMTNIAKRKHMDSSIGFIKVFYYLIICSHLITSIWLILNRVESYEDTWYNSIELDKAPSAQVYLEAAVYIVTTMMGMGAGNTIPMNKLEQFICMFIMLLGASIYATFFSFFVVLIYHRNAKMIENNRKLEQALNFADQLALKESLKNKIRFYYTTLRLKYDELLVKNHAM